jgi:hypothetical protein
MTTLERTNLRIIGDWGPGPHPAEQRAIPLRPSMTATTKCLKTVRRCVRMWRGGSPYTAVQRLLRQVERHWRPNVDNRKPAKIGDTAECSSIFLFEQNQTIVRGYAVDGLAPRKAICTDYGKSRTLSDVRRNFKRHEITPMRICVV